MKERQVCIRCSEAEKGQGFSPKGSGWRGKSLVLVAIGACVLLLGALVFQFEVNTVRADIQTTPRIYLPVVYRAPAPTPTPSVQYQITLVRQLTPCENNGNHHLYVLVLDSRGYGVPNTKLEFSWPTGAAYDVTGYKVENIPSLGINAQTTAGYVNFPMYRGSYRAKVVSGPSEQTDWLTVNIPVDQACEANGNPVGNSLYHYSYLIYFRKRF